MTALLWTIFIAIGFLSGSVLYCKIIPLKVGKNICDLSDDGNPGAFNAITHCGKKVGAICLCLDILKGFIPVFCACLIMGGGPAISLVVAAPVLGHAMGALNKFHGGKGIAVSFGVLAGIMPLTVWGFVLLVLLYMVFSTVIKLKSHTVRSIVVYALFAISSFVLIAMQGNVMVALGCVLVAAIVIVKHISGLKAKNEAR